MMALAYFLYASKKPYADVFQNEIFMSKGHLSEEDFEVEELLKLLTKP